MKIQTPIHARLNPDGTTSLYDGFGNEMGKINDPQAADEIVEILNGRGSHSKFGGNS
jgi:hypothetical protein